MDGQAQGKELRPHQRRLQGSENIRRQTADGLPQVRHKPQVRGLPRVRVPATETIVTHPGAFTGELAMPFQDAYERILQSTGLRTQTDVAALLGVKQSSISDAKRRNHIPDSWILTLFNKKGLNPSWIRTGEGPQYVAGTDTPPTPVLSEQQAAESLEPILRAALLGVVPELADQLRQKMNP